MNQGVPPRRDPRENGDYQDDDQQPEMPRMSQRSWVWFMLLMITALIVFVYHDANNMPDTEAVTQEVVRQQILAKNVKELKETLGDDLFGAVGAGRTRLHPGPELRPA